MSVDRTKCDPELGRRVHEYLITKGVETPMVNNGLAASAKIEIIEQKYKEIMGVLGQDITDDSLAETPKRVAKMLVSETLWGLDIEAFPKVMIIENKMDYDEMVLEKAVTINSWCEHHGLPITGKVFVGYVPQNKVLGISKLNRISDYYASRPQVQERLTAQICYALRYVLGIEEVSVVIEAHHGCVSMRGIKDASSMTVTSKLSPGLKADAAARAEFFAHIAREKQ